MDIKTIYFIGGLVAVLVLLLCSFVLNARRVQRLEQALEDMHQKLQRAENSVHNLQEIVNELSGESIMQGQASLVSLSEQLEGDRLRFTTRIENLEQQLAQLNAERESNKEDAFREHQELKHELSELKSLLAQLPSRVQGSKGANQAKVIDSSNFTEDDQGIFMPNGQALPFNEQNANLSNLASHADLNQLNSFESLHDPNQSPDLMQSAGESSVALDPGFASLQQKINEANQARQRASQQKQGFAFNQDNNNQQNNLATNPHNRQNQANGATSNTKNSNASRNPLNPLGIGGQAQGTAQGSPMSNMGNFMQGQDDANNNSFSRSSFEATPSHSQELKFVDMEVSRPHNLFDSTQHREVDRDVSSEEARFRYQNDVGRDEYDFFTETKTASGTNAARSPKQDAEQEVLGQVNNQSAAQDRNAQNQVIQNNLGLIKENEPEGSFASQVLSSQAIQEFDSSSHAQEPNTSFASNTFNNIQQGTSSLNLDNSVLNESNQEQKLETIGNDGFAKMYTKARQQQLENEAKKQAEQEQKALDNNQATHLENLQDANGVDSEFSSGLEDGAFARYKAEQAEQAEKEAAKVAAQAAAQARAEQIAKAKAAKSARVKAAMALTNQESAQTQENNSENKDATELTKTKESSECKERKQDSLKAQAQASKEASKEEANKNQEVVQEHTSKANSDKAKTKASNASVKAAKTTKANPAKPEQIHANSDTDVTNTDSQDKSNIEQGEQGLSQEKTSSAEVITIDFPSSSEINEGIFKLATVQNSEASLDTLGESSTQIDDENKSITLESGISIAPATNSIDADNISKHDIHDLQKMSSEVMSPGSVQAAPVVDMIFDPDYVRKQKDQKPFGINIDTLGKAHTFIDAGVPLSEISAKTGLSEDELRLLYDVDDDGLVHNAKEENSSLADTEAKNQSQDASTKQIEQAHNSTEIKLEESSTLAHDKEHNNIKHTESELNKASTKDSANTVSLEGATISVTVNNRDNVDSVSSLDNVDNIDDVLAKDPSELSEDELLVASLNKAKKKHSKKRQKHKKAKEQIDASEPLSEAEELQAKVQQGASFNSDNLNELDAETKRKVRTAVKEDNPAAALDSDERLEIESMMSNQATQDVEQDRVHDREDAFSAKNEAKAETSELTKNVKAKHAKDEHNVDELEDIEDIEDIDHQDDSDEDLEDEQAKLEAQFSKTKRKKKSKKNNKQSKRNPQSNLNDEANAESSSVFDEDFDHIAEIEAKLEAKLKEKNLVDDDEINLEENLDAIDRLASSIIEETRKKNEQAQLKASSNSLVSAEDISKANASNAVNTGKDSVKHAYNEVDDPLNVLGDFKHKTTINTKQDAEAASFDIVNAVSNNLKNRDANAISGQAFVGQSFRQSIEHDYESTLTKALAEDTAALESNLALATGAVAVSSDVNLNQSSALILEEPVSRPLGMGSVLDGVVSEVSSRGSLDRTLADIENTPAVTGPMGLGEMAKGVGQSNLASTQNQGRATSARSTIPATTTTNARPRRNINAKNPGMADSYVPLDVIADDEDPASILSQVVNGGLSSVSTLTDEQLATLNSLQNPASDNTANANSTNSIDSSEAVSPPVKRKHYANYQARNAYGISRK